MNYQPTGAPIDPEVERLINKLNNAVGIFRMHLGPRGGRYDRAAAAVLRCFTLIDLRNGATMLREQIEDQLALSKLSQTPMWTLEELKDLQSRSWLMMRRI